MQPSSLALGELEALTRFRLTILFALHFAWIACQQSMFTENSPVILIHQQQGPGHGQPDRSGLSANAATLGDAANIKRILILCNLERLTGVGHESLTTEMVDYVFSVNGKDSFTRRHHGAND